MCLGTIAALAMMQGGHIEINEIKMAGEAIGRNGDPTSECMVYDMSADGQTVVGTGTPLPRGGWMGFVWTKARGVQPLPCPEEMNIFSFMQAAEISADGKTVAGMALWLLPGSKLSSKFSRKALPPTVLGNVSITDTTIDCMNRDGTVMAVSVESSLGDKIFRWRLGRSGLEPVIDNRGKRIFGSMLDMSHDGSTMVGVRFDGGKRGFALRGTRYYEPTKPKEFAESSVEGVTRDGKTAFGNFHGDGKDQGFKWRIGSDKPTFLPKSFLVSSVTDDGEIVAGWHLNSPAIFTGRKVIRMAGIVGDLLDQELVEKLRIAAVKKHGDSLYVLADASGVTDYRFVIPLSRL